MAVAPTGPALFEGLGLPYGPDLNYEVTAEITSAADITASVSTEHLVGLLLRSAQSPGWFDWNIDGTNHAILPVNGPGVDATGKVGMWEYAFYPMNMALNGRTKVLASGGMTFGGGLSAVRAVLSDKPNPDPRAIKDWMEMRGVAVNSVETTTNGTSKTYSMPGGAEITPVAVVAMAAIHAGTATAQPQASLNFAAVPPFSNGLSIPANLGLPSVLPRKWPFPSALGRADSYAPTHKADSLGGATSLDITGVLYA